MQFVKQNSRRAMASLPAIAISWTTLHTSTGLNSMMAQSARQRDFGAMVTESWPVTRKLVPNCLQTPSMKFRPVIVTLAGITTAAAVVFVALKPVGGDIAVNGLRTGDPKVLAAGEKIYAERCASCHGTQLEGQPDWQLRGADDLLPAPPHDATGHTWHHRDDLLFRITKFGMAKAINLPDYKSTMPIYEGVLSDEEIVAVLSWIKSRWPASVREKHDQFNAQR